MSDANWYILNVEGGGIDRKIISLCELGVPCQNVSKIYARNHIAFPSVNVLFVIEYFGKKGTPYTLEPTNLASMFVMKFYDMDIDYSNPPGANFEYWSDLVPLTHSHG